MLQKDLHKKILRVDPRASEGAVTKKPVFDEMSPPQAPPEAERFWGLFRLKRAPLAKIAREASDGHFTGCTRPGRRSSLPAPGDPQDFSFAKFE